MFLIALGLWLGIVFLVVALLAEIREVRQGRKMD